MESISESQYVPETAPRSIAVKFLDDFKRPDEFKLPYVDGAEESFPEDLRRRWDVFKETYPEITLRRVDNTVAPERILELVATAVKLDQTYDPPNFLTFFKIRVSSLDLAQKLTEELSSWEIIEYAYVEGLPSSPGTLPQYQHYVEPPGIFPNDIGGINAPYRWTSPNGEAGSGIKFIDIEKGWYLDHVRFTDPVTHVSKFDDPPPHSTNVDFDTTDTTLPSYLQELGRTKFFNKAHGTYVLGIIGAKDDGTDWKGIARDSKGAVISYVWDDGSEIDIAKAITTAIATPGFGGGDVLLLEVQISLSGWNGNWPAESENNVFYKIQLATALGITVIEAAGNGENGSGGVSFDTYGPFAGNPSHNPNNLDMDSGAIIVGAATPKDITLPNGSIKPKGSRHPDSNYGNCIDCFAWGSTVYTTSVDENTGTPPASPYNTNWGGTSAASAIIAGVALVVQGIAKANGFGDNPNGTYKSATLRTILSLYGTPSNYPPTDLIGIMPDLQDIITNVLARICVPRPQTASGAFSGPPDWLAPVGSPQRDNLDDPRWTGALHKGFPVAGGTSEHALFRALYDTVGTDKFLYLSWWVKVDGSPDPDPDTGDHFYVGFQASPGSTAMVIKVVPFNLTSVLSSFTNKPAEGTTGVGSITTFTKTGVADWLVVTDPAWINDNTRIWFDRTLMRYAVQMKVPLKPGAASITNSAGPNLSTDFRMWYSMRVAFPTTTKPLVFYSWPDRQIPTVNGPTEQFSDPNIWGWYRLGTAGCASGVSLSYDDIGTTNTPTSRIRLNPNTNRLFARPKNASGNLIPAGKITARFRLANWGSMITYLNAPWDDIPYGTNVSHSADYPTGSSTSPGQASIPPNPPTIPNPTSTIWFDWTVGTSESQDFINGTKYPDQCMIVNLSGQGLTFTSDSACKNMMFDTSSVSVHQAAIDIRGLTPISAQPRDVYILVEKINMPTNTPAGYSEGKYLSTTINRIIAANNSEDPNNLGNRLRAAQKLLAEANPEATSNARLVEVMAELRLQLAMFEAKDEAHNKELTEQLVSLIESWLSVVKQNAAARKRLTLLLKSWASWLRASAAGGSIVETVEFIKVLTEWLSAINSDPTSSHLPRIAEVFRQWLANLVDNGSISKLSAVIDWFLSWLNSDRSSAMLLTESEALREWLASRGRDENMMRQKLAWVIQDVIHWLSPATDRLISFTSALSTAGVTAAEMEKIFPTCRFHAYHDTGRKEARRDGRSVPILEAQVPFGYWLYHEDDLKGWTAILEGATRLAENFYVVKVPNNGSTQITTKIQAVEQDEERIPEPPIVPLPTDGNTGCCMVIATWLDSKGPVGKILASVVHVLCRLLGQSTT